MGTAGRSARRCRWKIGRPEGAQAPCGSGRSALISARAHGARALAEQAHARGWRAVARGVRVVGGRRGCATRRRFRGTGPCQSALRSTCRHHATGYPRPPRPTLVPLDFSGSCPSRSPQNLYVPFATVQLVRRDGVSCGCHHYAVASALAPYFASRERRPPQPMTKVVARVHAPWAEGGPSPHSNWRAAAIRTRRRLS